MSPEIETKNQTTTESKMKVFGAQITNLLKRSPEGLSVVVAASMETGKPGEIYSFAFASGEDVARSMLIMLMSKQFVESGVTEAVLTALQSGNLNIHPAEDILASDLN